jgi:hypothetical protein
LGECSLCRDSAPTLSLADLQDHRFLKNCTARSCFSAAAGDENVPQLRRFPCILLAGVQTDLGLEGMLLNVREPSCVFRYVAGCSLQQSVQQIVHLSRQNYRHKVESCQARNPTAGRLLIAQALRFLAPF